MWLIDQIIFAAMQQAINTGFNTTSDQVTAYEARMLESSDGGGRILSTAGSNAEIKIEGVLTQKPSFLAMVFGGGNTTYAEIISAFATAEADPEVKAITMAVDSPGGQVDGLFDALAAIETVKKPIHAIVYNKAASAAYAIVAKADKITAKNRAASVGSIGIVATFMDFKQETTITSDKAPNKRPDVKTKSGEKVIKAELNTLHDLFAESIATGRKTTVEKVNSGFGKGAMLFADDALKAGMIDDISGVELKTVDSKPKTASGGNKKQGAFMDLVTLKAEHPALYAAVMEDGEKMGVLKERDRVGAFLVAGEQSGDMKTALAAINDGSEMTSTLSTTFLMAATNRTDVNKRQSESDDADPGTQAETEAAEAAEDKEILAIVQEKTGFKGGA